MKNFKESLERKLTNCEFGIVSTQLVEATDYYKKGMLRNAASALNEAVNKLNESGKKDAASKVASYLRFC